MNETWDPTDVPAATRGEFLAARETAVRELERMILSPLQVLLHSGLVFVATLAFVFAGAVFTEPGRQTVLVVIAAVLTAVGIAAAVAAVRRAVRNRKLTSALLAWETVERQARSLPQGQLRPDLRMPFDARQDADFETVAMDADIAAYHRVAGGRLWFRLTPPSLGLVLGFVFLMGVTRDAPVPERISWAVGGGYMMVCCLVAIAATMRLSWRLRTLWRALQADNTALRTERIGPIAAAEVDRVRLRRWWLFAAPFTVVPVLGHVVAVMTSSSASVALVVVVVAWAGLMIAVVLGGLWRTRRASVPAEHHITSVPPG